MGCMSAASALSRSELFVLKALWEGKTMQEILGFSPIDREETDLQLGLASRLIARDNG